METKKLFKITDRQGLVIYINNAHVLRRLRRYGHIMYYSRRLHYVILYVDQSTEGENFSSPQCDRSETLRVAKY